MTALSEQPNRRSPGVGIHAYRALPALLAALSFVAAVLGTAAIGFGAVSADESSVVGTDQSGVELAAGYGLVEGGCTEILPFGLEVPSSQTEVLKCVVITNRSSEVLTNVRLVDTDLGDGPVVVELIAPGGQSAHSTLVRSSEDLWSTTSIEGSLPTGAISLQVDSRAFVVEGAIVSGTAASKDAAVELVGRTRSGHYLQRRSEVDDNRRFAFDDLPPSGDLGYLVSVVGGDQVGSAAVVLPGDRVNITDPPLPLDVGTAGSPELADATASAESTTSAAAPELLAFDAGKSTESQRILFVVVTLSALVCALGAAGRQVLPVRR